MDLSTELLKVYGPLILGWVLAAYLLRFILSKYNEDIDSRVKLAVALDGLAKAISMFKPESD